MSYDLTVVFAPQLCDQQSGWLLLDRVATAAERHQILALADLLGRRLGVPPSIDRDRASIELNLSGSLVDGALEKLLPWAREAGCVVYDPQEGVFYYADGRDSRDEKAPGGVHEGVDICLRELQSPDLPEREKRDALDALAQFVLADSPDVDAARARALPVLDALGESDDPLAALYRQAADELRGD